MTTATITAGMLEFVDSNDFPSEVWEMMTRYDQKFVESMALPESDALELMEAEGRRFYNAIDAYDDKHGTSWVYEAEMALGF